MGRENSQRQEVHLSTKAFIVQTSAKVKTEPVLDTKEYADC